MRPDRFLSGSLNPPFPLADTELLGDRGKHASDIGAVLRGRLPVLATQHVEIVLGEVAARDVVLEAGEHLLQTIVLPARVSRIGLVFLERAVEGPRSEERRVGKECRSRWW